MNHPHVVISLHEVASDSGDLFKVLGYAFLCLCYARKSPISFEPYFQMLEGLEKHVSVSRSSHSYSKNGESASSKSTIVVQFLNQSRPSPHFSHYIFYLKPSHFLWHATTSSISHPPHNLWSNLHTYILTLHLNASTNTNPFHLLFNLYPSL